MFFLETSKLSAAEEGSGSPNICKPSFMPLYVRLIIALIAWTSEQSLQIKCVVCDIRD